MKELRTNVRMYLRKKSERDRRVNKMLSVFLPFHVLTVFIE